MKRVVVTGMGIWSCIGQDLQTVTESLKAGRSGIIFDPKRIEYGLQSGLVGNVPHPDLKPLLPRKFRATMSEDAEYAYMAARQAFVQAGIDDEYLRRNEVGIIWGSDFVTKGKLESNEIMELEKDATLLGPNTLFISETSSVSMNLSGIFNLKGINLCVGSACASSTQAIGVATTFIRKGLQDIILIGGASEIASIPASALLESVQGLSCLNNYPQKASRPYDSKRDGMITSGGGAALVLESYEHAIKRQSPIIAEVIGYGFSTDGLFVTERDYKCVVQSMQNALDDAGLSPFEIDYVNSFALSNIQDDILDAQALSILFGDSRVAISSTQSMTGHEHNMTGCSSTIYSLLMMQNNFIAPTLNLDEKITEARTLNIITNTTIKEINYIMINSSGLGGNNCTIILKKI